MLASHPASLDAAFIGVASLHCSFGKGKAAAELAKAVALIRGHFHFSRCARWLLCGDFNTDAKQQLLETLGPTWTEANEANVPTHRSGRDAHVQYDHIVYTTPQLGLVDFAVQPQQFEQLISHHVDQRRDAPPPFFSDHAILRATFLRE